MLSDDDQSRIRALVVRRLVEQVLARTVGPRGTPLEEILNESFDHEQSRLARAAPSERTDQERDALARSRRELPHLSADGLREALRRRVESYTGEICGHFDARVYTVATRILPLGLSTLLNGLSPRRALADFPEMPNLDDNIVLEGEVETLRRLTRTGTVILAPTHTSNLDSLLLGFAIFRMGLPPFTYGAGLNLFHNPITSFFMHNLGAYTVDRSKTDPLYRETLKAYATATLEAGQHNLFFPGGTRSRSGAIESHLKKGLLGAGLAAFSQNQLERKVHPNVYVFPCTCTYPLVLEAASLVDDYLIHEGRSHYIVVEDEFGRVRRWIDFLGGLLALRLRIHVRIGEPLDPFGNRVDPEGRSLDPHGRPLDPARYLLVDGVLGADPARDAEYTRMLEAKVIETFRRDNYALPGAVLAFATFDVLRRASPSTDLFRFLRALGSETEVARADVSETVARVCQTLRGLAARAAIHVDDVVGQAEPDTVIDRALETLGMYHTTPVLTAHGPRLRVGDPNLLFYYRNRLEGYGLLGGSDPVTAARSS